MKSKPNKSFNGIKSGCAAPGDNPLGRPKVSPGCRAAQRSCSPGCAPASRTERFPVTRPASGSVGGKTPCGLAHRTHPHPGEGSEIPRAISRPRRGPGAAATPGLKERRHRAPPAPLTGKVALVGPLGLEVAALVRAELGVRGEALGAHLALEQALLLVRLHVRLEVVHGGELLAAAAHRAAERPQLVVRLQVPLELVGRGEGPAAAVQRTLEGPPALEIGRAHV